MSKECLTYKTVFPESQEIFEWRKPFISRFKGNCVKGNDKSFILIISQSKLN